MVLLLAALAVTATHGTVAGQKVVVGPGALGTATSGASFASGANALTSTPARLAWNRLDRTELLFLSGGVRLGLRPVSPRDVARYSGKVLSAAVREEWLSEVESHGALEGVSSAVFSPFVIARGHFALQVTTSAEVTAALNPDAVEALLFGNAGRSGTPASLDFGGSTAEGWSMTTVALGGGFAMKRLSAVTGGEWAVGATAKFSFGHLLWSALDGGSGTLTDPLSLEGVLPVVATPLGASQGTGLALDGGAAWRNAVWSVDLFVRDLVNTFEWNNEELEFRRGVVAISPDSAFEGSERLGLDLAPLALRTRVQAFSFKPSLTLSLARRLSSTLEVAVEGSCGPTPLTPARTTRLGLSGADIDPNHCRSGASAQHVFRRVTVRGGATVGSRGADLGVGVLWKGSRGVIEVAYGRRLGDLPASGLAVAWGLYLKN